MNSSANSILVAGIGNIFMGDDAFGVETIRRLQSHKLPDRVRAVDFGIRSYDLAYAIAGDTDVVILVDATPRGDSPGTLYLIEPELDNLQESGTVAINGHTLNPVSVLLMARSLNSDALRPGRIYLIGCEPATLESVDGKMELSRAARAAVPGAVRMIRTLIRNLLSHEKPNNKSVSKAACDQGGNTHARRRDHRRDDSVGNHRRFRQ
jgi:hydrogenase maturation protease